MSLDLRERIVASYDRKEGTREEVARRFCVSVGMVKKLLQQRRRVGSIAAQYFRCGRKPLILEEHQEQMRLLLEEKPDLTLAELRQALGLPCSLPAIHYALKRMKMTYKKRVSEPVNRSVRTSSRLGKSGDGGRSRVNWSREG